MATKSERLEMRLTRDQKDLIERAARIKGLDVTSFAVPTVLEAAQEIVGRQSVTVLSDRDFKRFLQILDAHEEPAPKLKAAVKRLKKLRG
jgi:uncharacterized protein (DUF1778 family)